MRKSPENREPKAEPPVPGRRRFLESILMGVSGLASSLLALLPLPRFLLASVIEQNGAGGETRAGTVADLEREGALRTFHRGRPALVVRGPAAFSAKCTHLGCIVRWDAASSQIRCPCHGARFDVEGRPTSGPTRTPLEPVPIQVRNGEIFLG